MADDPKARARIANIALDERTVVRRSPDIEHERAVAIYDILEENTFALKAGGEGPYDVVLGVVENRLVLEVKDAHGAAADKVTVPLSPFRQIVKDYFTVCESYYNAIKHAPPSQIEAIDMGRRALHNEGTEMLVERLSDKVDLDFDTARRLFTLLCVLHLKG